MLRVVNIASRLSIRRLSSMAQPYPAQCLLPHDEVLARVQSVVSSIRSAPENVSQNATFCVDLEFDSLLIKEVIQKLGDEFCVAIPASDANKLYGVSEATKYFASHPKAR